MNLNIAIWLGLGVVVMGLSAWLDLPFWLTLGLSFVAGWAAGRGWYRVSALTLVDRIFRFRDWVRSKFDRR